MEWNMVESFDAGGDLLDIFEYSALIELMPTFFSGPDS
jgi:hypothetical protein